MSASKSIDRYTDHRYNKTSDRLITCVLFLYFLTLHFVVCIYCLDSLSIIVLWSERVSGSHKTENFCFALFRQNQYIYIHDCLVDALVKDSDDEESGADNDDREYFLSLSIVGFDMTGCRRTGL